jgi:CheY-like chemotaxis protein
MMRPSYEARLTRGAPPSSIILLAGHSENEARRVLAAALAAAGYRVRVAETGDELLHDDLADVSLIVAQVQLPCRDGPCAIQLFSAHRGSTRVPVLAYSTHALPADEAWALAAGAQRFLRDPFDLLTIFDTIAAMLDRDRTASGAAISRIIHSNDDSSVQIGYGRDA